jgi:hypothetical protein
VRSHGLRRRQRSGTVGVHHEVRVLAVMGTTTASASLGDHDLLAFAHNIG